MLEDSRPNGVSSERPELGQSEDFSHVPVMLTEIVAAFADAPQGVVVDCTLGGAGHAIAVLEAHEHLHVLGIDRDPVALQVAGERLKRFGDRAMVYRGRFDQIGTILEEFGVTVIAGFLFDLGVSSPQLDHADRGFSFRSDGPLDMRMDQSAGRTAADVVNTYDHGELARVLKRYGDERFAGRIASAIVAARPLHTTKELAEIVVSAIPAATRRTGGHPAKRTFQALRIEVNDELAILRPAIEAAVDALDVGGVGLVLTYHSGEDKTVKDIFRSRSTIDVPAGLPVTVAEAEFATMRPLARRPSDSEQERNPRSRSARLRGVVRKAAA